MCKMWLNVVVVAPCCSVFDARCSFSVNKSAAVDRESVCCCSVMPLCVSVRACVRVCDRTFACEIYILVFTCMVYIRTLCVSVCVSLRQPGLSSLDNHSLALVRQPSEAE